MTKPITTNRLHGLDLARFLAYVGMVIVNFSVVMGADDAENKAVRMVLKMMPVVKNEE